MWMLVSTLCLQLSATEARCERESLGPHLIAVHCRERARDHKAALIALAEDMNARVLFLSVSCQRGVDG